MGWQLKQVIIRHQMMEALEKSKLQTLVIDPLQIDQKAGSKEIFIDGQLFDIKEIHEGENSQLVVTGLFDKEETQLLDFVRKNLPGQNSQKLIGKFLQIQLTIPETAYPLSPFYTWLHGSVFADYKESFTQVQLSILVPPPKYAC